MKNSNRKVIISCAITGSTHTPSMSEYLPLTPEQIAKQSIEAAEAGAAIIHLHAREPSDGRPTPNPDVYRQFVPVIASATDAVYPFTSPRTHTTALKFRAFSASNHMLSKSRV